MLTLILISKFAPFNNLSSSNNSINLKDCSPNKSCVVLNETKELNKI